jgi:hypothetical protein
MSDSKQLQELLDDPACARVDWRDRGESRGRFFVRRRVTLDAENSAIVGIDGPAIVVEPGGHLAIRGGWISTSTMDLSSKAVGVADGWRRGPCIDVKHGGSICFEGTDVIGDVLGASSLSGEWHLPLVLRLPDLPARSRGVAFVRGFVPCEVEVTSEIHAVGATVRAVGPGPVEIGIDIDARDAENGVLLDGWICFTAQGARRRTRIRARTSSAAQHLPKAAIWEAVAYAKPPSLPIHITPPGDSAAPVSDPEVPARSPMEHSVAGRTEPPTARLSPIFRPTKPQGSPARTAQGAIPLNDARVGDSVQPVPPGTPEVPTTRCEEASGPVDGPKSGAAADDGQLSADISPGGDSPVTPPKPKAGELSPIFRRPPDKRGP